MKKGALISIVDDLLKSAERNLDDYAKDQRSESLHRLRVDLKKVKAAYSFAEFVFKKKFSTTAIKPLFKDAGSIREIQVNVTLLNQFPQPPKRLMARLGTKEKILSEAFVQNYSVHRKSIKDFRKYYQLPKKVIDDKKMFKYFDKMKNMQIEDDNAEELHRYRIRMKRMMHVYYMLPDKIQKKTNLDIDSIEKLQHQLGEWHDMHTAIHLLSGETVPKKAAEYIAKLIEQERLMFEHLKTSLIPNQTS
jgi:CHAD domain-containing protein